MNCYEFTGALTLASVLLYPKTLGGGAVFSGWVPFNSTMIERIEGEAKKVLPNIPRFLSFPFPGYIELPLCLYHLKFWITVN